MGDAASEIGFGLILADLWCVYSTGAASCKQTQVLGKGLRSWKTLWKEQRCPREREGGKEGGSMVSAWLCAFGRAGSRQDSAGTNQPQAVAKSSMKSGTKGFTGLEGIKLTPSEPRWCAHTCVCVCVRACV